jgi:hypothetical protein
LLPQQFLDAPALASLAFLDARQRLGQQLVKPRAQDVHQHRLAERLGFDRFVRAAVTIAAVFDDGWEVMFGDLRIGQRKALPAQRASDHLFYLAHRDRATVLAGTTTRISTWPGFTDHELTFLRRLPLKMGASA